MEKRGQAAMEFLMTYGWAILVVLAAIAALAYFGVLSPDRFLPEKCTLPSGTACLDFKYDTTNGITLIIQNSAGFDMSGVGVGVDGCAGNQTTGPTSLTDGEKATYTLGCLALTSGKFKGSINVTYTNMQTSLEHIKQGELILKVP
jgi:hypothetical protein